MKTIKPGNPLMLLPWWARVEWACARCGCVFQPEKGDDVSEYHDQREGESASIKCPTCQQSVTRYNSSSTSSYWNDR